MGVAPGPVQVDELLALDLLTLRGPTEQAGVVVDPSAWRAGILQSLAMSTCLVVRRGATLAAYAMLHPQPASDGMVTPGAPEERIWFVRGFNLHPDHRSAPVLGDLAAQVLALVRQEAVTGLCSHVYKTNQASLDFHRRLGFDVVRENDRALEFRVTAERLLALPVARRRRPAVAAG